MPTCSFDREYVLEDTPENRRLFEKLISEPQESVQRDRYISPTESEKREFIEKLKRSRNWEND